MAELQVRDLIPSVGAEVRGLEPQIPLDDETCAQLRALFDERSVLVFPDFEIDEEFQRYLCHMLARAPMDALKGGGDDDAASGEPGRKPPLQFVSNKVDKGAAPYGRLLFHCDTMWAEHSQPVISLYGIEVEQPNVPTLFVSMGHGWDTLSPELRQRVEGLEVRHGHEDRYVNRGGDDDVIDARFDAPKWTVTPVANPHPRTGRVGLYVSEQETMDVLGLDHDESEALLVELSEHLYDPEHILEHEWHDHDLVVWDNLAVQHSRKTVALDGPTRTLRKITGPMTFSVAEVPLPKFSKVSQ
jgi:taurine dioxygenase